MRSTTSSSKKLNRLCYSKFWQKAHKLAKKPTLTSSTKAKTYAFDKAHLDWTTENWKKIIFFDASTVQQFTSRKRVVRKSFGATRPLHHPNDETPSKHHGLGSNVCAWYSWSVFPPARYHHKWCKIPRCTQG